MAYTPTNWADGATPVDEAHMDKMETGISDAHADVAALQSGKVNNSEKGAVSGVATLDSASRLVQKHTVDKLYAQGIAEGFHPVARSGVAVWEAAAAGGGADLSYDGDWAAGTYQDGDVVVKDGIAYLCVGGPTTVAPDVTPWGGAVANRPAGELAYKEFLASVTITATTPATAQAIVTADPISCDGATPLVIEFFAADAYPDWTAINRELNLHLYQDGALLLSGWGKSVAPVAGYHVSPFALARRLTPSAGAHTYSVRASVNGGTGTVDFPGYIRIVQANPVFIAPTGPTVCTYGLALPSSPADGQEHILVDSLTNPSYQWRFRYNAGSSSAYKWEYVGGAKAQVPTAASVTPAVGWAALAAPRFTVPRAGEYICEANAMKWTTGAGLHGLGVALAAAANPVVTPNITAAGSGFVGIAPSSELLTLAAAASIAMFTYAAASSTLTDRVLAVTPVRVA